MTSLALADLKKRNAAALEEKRREELLSQGRYDGPPKPLDHEKPNYPKYAEYEVILNVIWQAFQYLYLHAILIDTAKEFLILIGRWYV